MWYTLGDTERTHHDQAHHPHHHHSSHRHHPRTHHRLHHRTADSTTTRQRTTLHHHHIITMQILSRRQAARPSRTRHLHRPHRHTMVPRRPKPIQRHRMVALPTHGAAIAALFLYPKPQQHKTTKTNKTKHTIYGGHQTKQGGQNHTHQAALPRHAYVILSWPFCALWECTL